VFSTFNLCSLPTHTFSRFHSPSEISGAIAATVLEDKEFVASYIGTSRKRLAEDCAFATEALDKAGIDYVRNGFVTFFLGVS
jgi:hypothetical protein